MIEEFLLKVQRLTAYAHPRLLQVAVHRLGGQVEEQTDQARRAVPPVVRHVEIYREVGAPFIEPLEGAVFGKKRETFIAHNVDRILGCATPRGLVDWHRRLGSSVWYAKAKPVRDKVAWLGQQLDKPVNPPLALGFTTMGIKAKPAKHVTGGTMNEHRSSTLQVVEVSR